MKPLKFIFVLLLATISPFVFAQKVQEMTFQKINRVDIQGIMIVELKQGETNKVNIEALNGADLDDLSVGVSGGELEVKTKILKQLTNNEDNRRRWTDRKMYKVSVTYQGPLRGIDVGRGAEVNFIDVIKANRLTISASSGAMLNIDIDTEDLELTCTQGAEVRIAGRAAFQATKVNTGGELYAYELVSEEAEVKANMGGMARIYVKRHIDASASMGGEVSYRGKPDHHNVSRFLGGEVHSKKTD